MNHSLSMAPMEAGRPKRSFRLNHLTRGSKLLPFKEWPVPFHTEEKPQGSEGITLGKEKEYDS